MLVIFSGYQVIHTTLYRRHSSRCDNSSLPLCEKAARSLSVQISSLRTESIYVFQRLSKSSPPPPSCNKSQSCSLTCFTGLRRPRSDRNVLIKASLLPAVCCHDLIFHPDVIPGRLTSGKRLEAHQRVNRAGLLGFKEGGRDLSFQTL